MQQPDPSHQVRHMGRHTSLLHKSKPAQEPALFLRFRDTPYFVGHILSVQNTKSKGEHTTGGFMLCWQT